MFFVRRCVNVECFGMSLSREQQEAKRMHFKDVLPFKGPVKLKNPVSEA